MSRLEQTTYFDAFSSRPRSSRRGPYEPCPPASAAHARHRYFVALERNATSAWIWLGLRVFEKLFGMMPAL